MNQLTRTETLSPVEEEMGENSATIHRCNLCAASFHTRALLARHTIQLHKATKKFRCTQCSASFNSQKNVSLHRAIHGPKPFKCPKCMIIFRRYATLVGHIERHYVPEDHVCVVCNREFPTVDDLKAHVYEGHETDKIQMLPRKKAKTAGAKTYQCTFCENKVFTKLSLLERHFLIHTKQKPFVCNICGKSFNQKSSLKTHSLTHDDIRDFVCLLCGLKFSQKTNLRVHTLRVHPKKNVPLSDRLPCPYCPCIFKKLGSLNAHKTKIHAAILSNPVRLNEDSTNNQESLKQEAPIMQPQSPPGIIYKCETCEINFHDMAQLEKHLNRHSRNTNITNERTQLQTPEIIRPIVANRSQSHMQGVNEQRRFSCDICSAAFKKSSHLKQHVKSHYGIKGNRCEICDKTFTTSHTLKVHRNSHCQNSQLHYKCEQCPTRFSLLSSLRRHTKLHDNPDRSFSCPFCKRAFKWYQNCKTHIRKVHPEEAKNLSERLSPLATHGGQTEAIQFEELAAGETMIDLRNLPENVGIVDISNLGNCIVRIDDQLYEIPFQIEANDVGEGFLPISFHESSAREHSEQQESRLDSSVPTDNIVLEASDETVFQYIYESADEIPQDIVNQQRRAVSDPDRSKSVGAPTRSKQRKITSKNEQDLFGETIEAGKKCYHCKACEKPFKKPADLRRHIRTHTGERPFHCYLCSKSFTLKAILHVHMKTHDLKREAIICPEPGCGRKFSSKTSLDLHHRIHTGDRPFRCTVCTLTFRTSGHMQAHMTSHSRLTARQEQDNAELRYER
ncbi:zinc finger protein 236-like [Wyeomyia smithii]|uniref:zinc finger protein 236-like n=1 Tax=Wyeomyia smithii TaxID=174621 RepID=UPI002467E32D|nr:zinc finger protein 236-like [Wyeomyia smithii]